MRGPSKPKINARKRPLQARSRELVEDILEAAIRVLKRQGAQRFTTVRVAEEAGVSVGSLYQYFPNKEALLYRLQRDEWSETLGVLDEILGDERAPPFARFRRMVLTFFRSEHQEAALRVALDDAGALFRDTPEARAHLERARARIASFLDEALPGASKRDKTFAADFVMTSLSSIAEAVTAQGRTRLEVDAWAKTLADMLCSYFASLDPSARG